MLPLAELQEFNRKYIFGNIEVVFCILEAMYSRLQAWGLLHTGIINPSDVRCPQRFIGLHKSPICYIGFSNMQLLSGHQAKTDD